MNHAPPVDLLEQQAPKEFDPRELGAVDEGEVEDKEPVFVAPPRKPPVPARQRKPAPPAPVPLPVAKPVRETSNVVAVPDARKVCFLLPQYKSTNPLTLFSILANWDRAECGLSMHYGDGFIVNTRNSLATQFMRSAFEWALFVDDDMVLPMGNSAWFKSSTGWTSYPDELAAQKTLPRLMSHGRTLVGALYYGRGQGGSGRPMYAGGFRDPAEASRSRAVLGDVQGRGAEATEWIGTGCLLVHRSVFEAIQKRFPHLGPKEPGGSWRYFSPAPDQSISVLRQIQNAPDIETARQLATVGLSDASMVNSWSGEDIVFCRRAAEAGHTPYVDLGLICGHVGSEVYGPTNTRG